jgi:hypothetical protein
MLSQIPWTRLQGLQVLRLPLAPLSDAILIVINAALQEC